jgi:hypothetical protein
MNFRNSKNTASKNTASKSARKTNKTFAKLSEVEGSVQIEDGEMWLKSSKDMNWAPGVSINVDENNVISDWVRKITLRNVVLTVEENDKGYPELVISGQSNTDDAGDLPF